MSRRDDQLLEALRGADGWVDGETLIALVGHRFSATILRLRKEGYAIETRSGGTNPRTGNRRCDQYRLNTTRVWACTTCDSEVVPTEDTLSPTLKFAGCLRCRQTVYAKQRPSYARAS